jgi:hypothetical protein
MTARQADDSLSDDYSAYAPRSPGDSDLGEQLLLRRNEKLDDFLVQADVFVFWTNNAEHVDTNRKSDAFWGWRSFVNWHPNITSQLIADVGVTQDWYRYDRFDDLDFETLAATAGLIYLEPRLKNVAFFAQYEFDRFTQDFDDLTRSHSIRAGAQKQFVFNRRSNLVTSLLGDWDFDNNVDSLKRNEYQAEVAWNYKLLQPLELTLSYRYTLFDYTEVDRSDSLHSLNLCLVYSPNKWLQIYAGANYNFNNSNHAVYDYEAANMGGGVGAKVKF